MKLFSNKSSCLITIACEIAKLVDVVNVIIFTAVNVKYTYKCVMRVTVYSQ